VSSSDNRSRSQLLTPCCAPTKARAELLLSSVTQSNSRVRATEGSVEDMIRVEKTEFLMGSEESHAVQADGEGPVRRVLVDSFYLDREPVTNIQFAEFVRQTAYRTDAERFGWSFVFRNHLPPTWNAEEHPPTLPWWCKVDRADWSHPEGPDSSIASRDNHPAIHVSWNDARAYAQWAGKRLATEAEWEVAARGGLEQQRFPWGSELTPKGKHLCNIWQGEFPDFDTGEDGFTGTSPADAYAANAFGFRSMTGNVWEWCFDWFSQDYHRYASRRNPVGPPQGATKTMKGGSFLCHASYCNRYRVSARSSNTPDSTTANIGFRCARDVAS